MKNTLAILLLTLISSNAFAYPLFFKCDANGAVSNILQPAELVTQLRALADASLARPNQTARRAADEACSSAQNCIQDLVRLTELTRQAGELNRDEIVRRVEAKARQLNEQIAAQGSIQISESDQTEIAALNRANVMSYSCRAVVNELDSTNFIQGDKCIVGNFNHSPYMYLSGERFSGVAGGEDRKLDNVSCSQLDSAIDSAVAMGQDPYAALGISFMENGTDVGGLYLDPIGLVGTMGCPANRVSAEVANKWEETAGNTFRTCVGTCSDQACNDRCSANYTRSAPYNLNSYDTFYRVNFAPITNNTLANRVRQYVEARSPNAFRQASGFVCSSESSVFFSETAVADQCCLATSYMPAEDSNGEVVQELAKSAFTFGSLRQYIQAPLTEALRRPGAGENAARRLQRFNGYSDLMGGAEAVSAWRSGVNYNNTPAYGYQAMDFVYNSLMSNPMIVQKIEAAQRRYGRTKSIICADRPAGAFYTSSDLYFKKHGESPRMGRIQAAWDRGVTEFSRLSRREQNVLRGEFEAICRGQLSRQNLSAAIGSRADAFYSACSSDNMQAQYTAYMRNILPARRTVAQASRMDQGYTWERMTDDQFNGLIERVDARAARDNRRNEIMNGAGAAGSSAPNMSTQTPQMPMPWPTPVPEPPPVVPPSVPSAGGTSN